MCIWRKKEVINWRHPIHWPRWAITIVSHAVPWLEPFYQTQVASIFNFLIYFQLITAQLPQTIGSSYAKANQGNEEIAEREQIKEMRNLRVVNLRPHIKMSAIKDCFVCEYVCFNKTPPNENAQGKQLSHFICFIFKICGLKRILHQKQIWRKSIFLFFFLK